MKTYEHHGHGLRARQSVDEAIGWRYRTFVKAGFSEATARGVAPDPLLDIHALLQLTDRGCPPDVAVRILAPFGDEVGP